MPVPTTGSISFGQLRSEGQAGTGGTAFTGAFPLNDATFRTELTNTTTGQSLALSSLRGNAFQRFNIAANTSNYDIRSAMTGAGWNGTAKASANVVVAAGVYVSGTTSPAMTTSTPWPAPSRIVVRNAGEIVSRGGNGGAGGASNQNNPNATQGGGTAGQIGSTGLVAQRAMTLVNTGGIRAGGGGGGGGVGRRQGSPPRAHQSGGGGGGRTSNDPTSGGAAGNAINGPITPGQAGIGGSAAAAGGGGTGSSPAPRNDGGTGGGWGTAGNPGSGDVNGILSGFGGSPGTAISGISLVTQSPLGTVTGPTSG